MMLHNLLNPAMVILTYKTKQSLSMLQDELIFMFKAIE